MKIKIRLKAFIFALRVLIKVLPKTFMIHYNSYIACNTNLNPFGIKSTGQGELIIIGTPKKDD